MITSVAKISPAAATFRRSRSETANQRPEALGRRHLLANTSAESFGAAKARRLPGRGRRLRTFLSMVAMAIAPQFALAESRSFSLDDMMKVEGLESAVSDPTGRWFFYERVRPYDEFTDYSFRTYAFQKTGHQLWRYDLKHDGAPELIPGLDPEPHSFLQGFSPSGRYLAVMQYSLGKLSLLAYDMRRESSVAFKASPAFGRAGEHNPVWVSDDEVIFAALPEGQLPAATSVRAHSGNVLWQSWNDAWRGDVVTAHEVRTFSEDRSHEQEDGFLVRANARTGEEDLLAEGLFVDLRVSPDGRKLAGLAVSRPRPVDPDVPVEQDPRRHTLTLVDLRNGSLTPLASELDFFPYSITWSPDGKRIAAYGWKDGEDARNGRFYVIDIATGAVTRYEHKGLDLASERERYWRQRPERVAFLGDALAVFARKIPATEDQAPRFTYRNFAESGLPRADWYLLSADGASINLTEGLPGVSGVPVHARKGQITIWAEDGVYRLLAEGGRQRLTPDVQGRFRFLASGTFATRSSVIRPDFADEALFDVQGDGLAKIVMVDLREGGDEAAVVVEAPTSDAAPLAGSSSAGAILFRSQSGQASQLLTAREGASEGPKVIDSINDHLADLAFGSWEVVSYDVDDPSGASGPQRIESCVLLPANFDRNAPPPLVVKVYPDVGPRCKSGNTNITYPSHTSPYLWASKGYAFAQLTTPRALIRTDEGPIAGIDDLIEAGVEALVEGGFADPERLVLYGFSQGAVSALYVAAHSKRFKGVIAKNGWADLFSHYFGAAGIYSYAYGEFFGAEAGRYDPVTGTDFGIGRTPFEDPMVYYRNSPVFLAPQIEMPVFLIHSDMDAFSMSQFDEMYGALLRAGKDARYVRYWGEGHGPSSPANIRDMWDRIESFLQDAGAGARR